MQISLEGQTAIVTGANSGLGRGIALAYAKAGANVVVNYHSHQDQADEVVSAITAAGGKAIPFQADVGEEADVQALFAAAIDKFGAIDIVVANSGRQDDAPSADMTLAQWEGVLKTNLTGQFLCMREAVRTFRKQGQREGSRALGKIICMSSVHQRIPWAGHVNYAASKGGVHLLMETMAQEMAPERIRINAIAPGAIKTAINADVTADGGTEALLKLIPYGRVGQPEDVANAALFLASDLADYVVGSTLFVDGGMALYPGFEDNG
ncbi:sugar dehydrogenase [Duganella sp. Leaf126]|uniref:SDR family oxidoreductase n=1 Tax=Duganella sp. Leaf126 TaxID=1736266 RepID=UPI000700EE85|nr:SDR family oxidoreductase [Duganella sp. Leaf126]KQQ40361.1 sugar dehydrogenase [Duganella sp. Leaf126]